MENLLTLTTDYILPGQDTASKIRGFFQYDYCTMEYREEERWTTKTGFEMS